METSIQTFINLCEWDTSHFLIYSNNVFDNLIYYSHLLPLIITLLISTFIYFKNTKLLSGKWLLATSILLAIWLFSDLVLWATEKPSYTMFFWSLLVLIEPMIYAGMLFFTYALIDNSDISFNRKLIIFGLLLPTIILTPTHFALTQYDLSNCDREAIEGPLAMYGYAVEIILSLWILIHGMERIFKQKNYAEKKKITLITIATVFFLLSFAMGNVIGSLLVNWQIGQYGLFGIPIFIGMLAYILVKYHAFNIKVISTQILVAALWVLILALLFLKEISIIRLVVIATLILLSILGYALINSVKKEVILREQLQVANEGQSTLIHFINHQIKGYLSKGRSIYAELLSEDDYGPLNDSTKEMLKTGEESLKEGVEFVQDILKSSDIDKGTMTYNMEHLDFRKIVSDMAEDQKKFATDKGLQYEVNISDADYEMRGDVNQLKEAVRNLINNSISYTPKGSINISLSKDGNKIKFSIKDTGVGLSDELKPKLFTKGGTDKDSRKINVNSTGFGLSIVKGVIDAHHGKVWAESEGVGKGSTFTVELPIT